ncbi:MAG: hypothetical protein FWG51_05815 [Firmicutes bacterium]|nr:hypothetical protein [Bacillota bacterium]
MLTKWILKLAKIELDNVTGCDLGSAHENRIGIFACLVSSFLSFLVAILFGFGFIFDEAGPLYFTIPFIALGMFLLVLGVIFFVKHRDYIEYCKETIKSGEIYKAKVISGEMREYTDRGRDGSVSTGRIYFLTFEFTCEGKLIKRTAQFSIQDCFHYKNLGYIKVCYDKNYNRTVYLIN